MNKILPVIILLISSGFLKAQTDTMYVMKAGIVINKQSIKQSDVDSIVFYNPAPLTVTDIDGNVYKTIKIGNQIWMAENLKTIHYRNGDAITNLIDDNAWANANSGAFCWYNNDLVNKDIYGALYNGYAVKDSRNIAPTGWHVATKDEWNTLIIFLGGESVAGGKMKETGISHWASPNNDATNESSFNALPGGCRAKSTGAFQNKGIIGFYRTSTEELDSGYDNSWHIMLFNQNANITPSYSQKVYGYSVRCIKD